MNIVILGSSGSIGTQSLSLLKDHPEHKVIGLSVKSKIELLKEQAKEWQVPKLCVYEEALAEYKENPITYTLDEVEKELGLQ